MSLLKRQKRASGTHQGHQSDKTKWNPTVTTPHGESSLLVSSFPFLYSFPLSSEFSSRATQCLSFLSLHSWLLLFSFFLLLSVRVPLRYFISVPPLTRCKRVKEAEKARVRPESARGGMGLEPFKGSGERWAQRHLSRNFSAVVSKAFFIFLCHSMQTRVINRMFILTFWPSSNMRVFVIITSKNSRRWTKV